MSSQYYYKDYEAYLLMFQRHSRMVAEMMSSFNDQIFDRGLSPVDSDKLYQITSDLLYHVDQSYKEEKNIPDKYDILSFPSSDAMLNSMRSVFKEELDRYLGSSDATNQ